MYFVKSTNNCFNKKCNFINTNAFLYKYVNPLLSFYQLIR